MALTKKPQSSSSKVRAVHWAEAKVLEDGLEIPTRPWDDQVPGLPVDLTSVDDRDLMELMSKLTTWLEYMGVRLVKGEIDERELELAINAHNSQLLVNAWGGTSKDRVRIVRAEADLDAGLLKLKEDHLKAQAYRKVLQTLYDATDRKIAIVSRELTRRLGHIPYEARVKRWGNA